ncbi:Peptidase family S41 [Planctomycetes bacterium Pla163]|uniref:Peptidase family S41 n=1 Tax=Rohdeia mirabilis TaxID=2528008 RepID=A0A518CZY6_9BACT|nr:Peptidase family S41 [Planctomycetes bacterium Pla163]
MLRPLAATKPVAALLALSVGLLAPSTIVGGERAGPDNPIEARTASALSDSVQDVDYAADVEFALDALEERCGHFFDAKDIDWKKVRKQFTKEVRDVATHQEHLVLLVRLLARLEDGHAQVRPLPAGEDVRWPDEPERVGPGMFWCQVGKKIYVKNAWGTAAALGIHSGWEVKKVGKQKVLDWLDERVAELSDRSSFSTDHQAFFYACHWGLALPVGTRLDLELKTDEGKTKRRTLVYEKGNPVPSGPAFAPPGLPSTGLANAGDLYYGLLEYEGVAGGLGYVHVRRCPSDLPEQMDAALATLSGAAGIVLDFRGNSGGGFDHEGLMGRFVPAGETLDFVKSYSSAGAHPFGGPVVVIVDATVRSAGETASGMFKEDGRAYMIGESNTAGMSSSKTTIELPSGLFSLYVSVASNMGRFNEGKGLEGIGAVPHEIVEFDPEDLFAERDTLILRALELLADGDLEGVPYRPH